MKRSIFVFALLAAISCAAFGQSDNAGREKSLRGLKGIRLVVMFARADAIAEEERPAILKLVEDDATAKFVRAGIPLLRYAGEVENAGSPRLIVYITLDKPNGFVYPLVAKVQLSQRVRLARDLTIEADVVTWEQSGIGGPPLTVEMIRSLVASEIDQFIEEFIAANPK